MACLTKNDNIRRKIPYNFFSTLINSYIPSGFFSSFGLTLHACQSNYLLQPGNYIQFSDIWHSYPLCNRFGRNCNIWLFSYLIWWAPWIVYQLAKYLLEWNRPSHQRQIHILLATTDLIDRILSVTNNNIANIFFDHNICNLTDFPLNFNFLDLVVDNPALIYTMILMTKPCASWFFKYDNSMRIVWPQMSSTRVKGEWYVNVMLMEKV